ncbi:MAG: biotin/lipoyl-containing protein [Sedimentibacter sp.]
MKKFNIKVNGKAYAVEVEEAGENQGSFTYVPVQPIQAQQPRTIIQPETQVDSPKAISVPVSGETITAPMPGTILDIKVKEGQIIKAGDVVLILEAMKMENEITAPSNGTIVKLHTSKGSTVSTGDVLVTIV